MPRDEYEYYESNEDDHDIPDPPDSSPEWVWDDETGSYVWDSGDAETDADFEDFAEDFDDDAGDDEYESEDVLPPGYDEDFHPDDDGEAPDWWQEGMPDDWWDYYGDDYEIEEFEIAIDY